jgi:hypothetical protein
MKHLLPILLVFILSVGAISCRKTEEFPVEPHIEFKEIIKNTNSQGKDTSIALVFTFTDGDGDIGFHQNETGDPYTGDFFYNLHIDYQEKNSSGQFVPVLIPTLVDSVTPDGEIIPIIKDMPVQFKYRLPYLVPSGKNKAIKGDISVDINTFGFSPVSRLIFYIYDRALNKSNTEITTEFSVN